MAVRDGLRYLSTFTQKKGPRTGQKYDLFRHKDGYNYRHYRGGPVIVQPGQDVAFSGARAHAEAVRSGHPQYTPPAPPAPAAPAPAAPAPPAPAPAPRLSRDDLMRQKGWLTASGYLTRETNARTERDQALVGLLNQENELGLESGISFDRADVDVDGDGSPDVQQATNFRIAADVDVSNPFSKAALLKKSWMQGRKGNTNSMAARGQLYSGALQNAQNRTDTGFAEGQDSLLKGFGAQARDIFQRRYGAKKTYDEAVNAAVEDWINQQLASQPEDPGPPVAPANHPQPQAQASAQGITPNQPATESLKQGANAATALANDPYEYKITRGKRWKRRKNSKQKWFEDRG